MTKPTPDALSQSSRRSSIRVIWQKSKMRCPRSRSRGSSLASSCIFPLELRSSADSSGLSGGAGEPAITSSALLDFRSASASSATFFASPLLRAARKVSFSADRNRNGWLHTFCSSFRTFSRLVFSLA